MLETVQCQPHVLSGDLSCALYNHSAAIATMLAPLAPRCVRNATLPVLNPRGLAKRCLGGGKRRHYSRTCGLIGMPNVGKSTLFNALCSTQLAQAENYPFCTIDPNTALVDVPDDRLTALQGIAQSAVRIPTRIEFNDIAGLVRGASAGAGLGNKFLSHIRQTSVLLHVVRCFEDPDIIHVEDTVDPLRDIEIIESELVLADLESVERQLEKRNKKKQKGQAGTPDPKVLQDVLGKLVDALGEGRRAADTRVEMVASGDDSGVAVLDRLGLLSAKPQLFVCNVGEEDAAHGNDMSRAVAQRAEDSAASAGDALPLDGAVTVCSRLEEECSGLNDENQKEMLAEFGLDRAGLDRVVQASSQLLGLQTFYTVGPKGACPVCMCAPFSIANGGVGSHAGWQRHMLGVSRKGRQRHKLLALFTVTLSAVSSVLKRSASMITSSTTGSQALNKRARCVWKGKITLPKMAMCSCSGSTSDAALVRLFFLADAWDRCRVRQAIRHKHTATC